MCGVVIANSIAARDRATYMELLPPTVWQQGTGTGLHVWSFYRQQYRSKGQGQGYMCGVAIATSVAARDRATCVEVLGNAERICCDVDTGSAVT
jgi:hypothetical protein